MKVFDYTGSRKRAFHITLGDTVTVWKQVLLFSDHLDFIVQHRASCGYLAVMTVDDGGHLEPRDLVKLVNGGQVSLLFPPDASVAIAYWTDYDMTSWYNNDHRAWHVVSHVPRAHG